MIAALLAQQNDFAFTPNLEGFLALGAGILILVLPKSLNYIVAIYLIVVGAILLFNITI